MHTIEIKERNISFKLPSNWAEMTHQQIKDVMKEYFLSIEKGFSPLSFNINILYYLANIDRSWKAIRNDNIHPEFQEQHTSNIILICEQCLEWITEDEDGIPRITFDLIENILPEIAVNNTKLIGPADLLQDLTFAEYRQSINAYNSFVKSQNIDDLDELLVFLYREETDKPNLAGRRVVDISDDNFPRLLNRVKKIPSWQKNLILLWFTNCIKVLQTGTINVDGEDINLSLLFSESDNTKAYSSTWNDLVIQIAKERIVGNRDQVDAQPLYSIFAIMWHNFKDWKNNEKSRKSN